MLKNGANDSCIVTVIRLYIYIYDRIYHEIMFGQNQGESIVFQWLDIDEPDTLRYHLTLPGLDVYSDEYPT